MRVVERAARAAALGLGHRGAVAHEGVEVYGAERAGGKRREPETAHARASAPRRRLVLWVWVEARMGVFRPSRQPMVWVGRMVRPLCAKQVFRPADLVFDPTPAFARFAEDLLLRYAMITGLSPAGLRGSFCPYLAWTFNHRPGRLFLFYHLADNMQVISMDHLFSSCISHSPYQRQTALETSYLMCRKRNMQNKCHKVKDQSFFDL